FSCPSRRETVRTTDIPNVPPFPAAAKEIRGGGLKILLIVNRAPNGRMACYAAAAGRSEANARLDGGHSPPDSSAPGAGLRGSPHQRAGAAHPGRTGRAVPASGGRDRGRGHHRHRPGSV